MRLPGFQPSRSSAIRTRHQAYVVGVPSDLSASMYHQAKQALDSIDQSLQKMGLSKKNIALVTVYLADMAQKAEMNRAWDEWASPENPPVRACVDVVLEPGCLVEMVVTATTDGD
jgi:enamine deaminase RidA (YjgF/YER057c/UK114 family)